jgi:flagellar biosynthesis GTPase FlhF
MLFMVPYQRNPHFRGRATILQMLRQKLGEIKQEQYNHRFALFGPGGIGKTQLALEYVYRYQVTTTKYTGSRPPTRPR